MYSSHLSADLPNLVELGLFILRSVVSNGLPCEGGQCACCPAWQGTLVSAWGWTAR